MTTFILKKNTFLSSLFFYILLGIQSVSADLNENAQRLFSWAEIEYTQYFSPSDRPTQETEEWIYRFYPTNVNYLGIHKASQDVYVTGYSFGDEIQRVGSLNEFLAQIEVSAQAENCIHLTGRIQAHKMYYASSVTTEAAGVVDFDIDLTILESTNEYMKMALHSTVMINGLPVVANGLSEMNFYYDGNYVMAESMTMAVDTSVQGSLVDSQNVLTHYSPAKVDGMVNQVCLNDSRESGALLQSTTTNGVLETELIPITHHTVESISETVNTLAGQFTTLKFVSSSAQETTIHWIAVDTEIPIKSEKYVNGLLVDTMLLTSYEL